MKYLINKMQLSQQVLWLDGRGVCLDHTSQWIKPYKCCVYGQQW